MYEREGKKFLSIKNELVAILAIWRLEKKALTGPFFFISKRYLGRQCIKTEEILRRKSSHTGNKKDTLQKVSFQMVGAAGFEPTTSRSRTVRATICATPR